MVRCPVGVGQPQREQVQELSQRGGEEEDLDAQSTHGVFKEYQTNYVGLQSMGDLYF